MDCCPTSCSYGPNMCVPKGKIVRDVPRNMMQSCDCNQERSLICHKDRHPRALGKPGMFSEIFSLLHNIVSFSLIYNLYGGRVANEFGEITVCNGGFNRNCSCITKFAEN